MNKRYIKYFDNAVYAIVYYKSNVICYNLNFSGNTQLIILKY